MCGLFSYIGAKNNHNFNWDKFNFLGVDNDERGGDSIGRVLGDNIERFVSKKVKTTYQQYVIDHKNSDPHHIAIGHTRKASIGEVSEITAQPVVLDLPDGTGRFVMVHNGTLHNWQELATKYKISTAGKSDSMVFAEIIMNHGFNVLLEYNGTAAIIIKDDREPDTIKVFKGRSKGYGVNVTEERPLYYYQESENSMYISSKEEGLFFIGGDGDNVVDFDTNKLYTIHEGAIVSQVVYNRSDCLQNKVFVSTTPTYGNTYYKKKNYANTSAGSEDFDSMYDMEPTAFTGAQHFNIKRDYLSNPNDTRQIVAAKLRYYFFADTVNATYANGEVILNEKGIKQFSKCGSKDKIYFFYRGIMLKNRTAYEEAKLEFGKARDWMDTDDNIIKMCRYSMYPICSLESAVPMYENTRKWTGPNLKYPHMPPAEYYNGTVEMLFSKKKYYFSNGSLKDIDYKKEINLAVHDEPASSFPAVIKTPIITTNNVKNVVFTHPVNCTCNACYKAISEVFRDDANFSDITKDNEEIVDVVDENDDQLEKTISDGLQAIMLAIDSFNSEMSITGITSTKAKTIATNLSKIEDVLYDVEKFKTKNIITDYERF